MSLPSQTSRRRYTKARAIVVVLVALGCGAMVLATSSELFGVPVVASAALAAVAVYAFLWVDGGT